MRKRYGFSYADASFQLKSICQNTPSFEHLSSTCNLDNNLINSAYAWFKHDKRSLAQAQADQLADNSFHDRLKAIEDELNLNSHRQSCNEVATTTWSNGKDPSRRSAKLMHNALRSVSLDLKASKVAGIEPVCLTNMYYAWSKKDYLSFCNCISCLTYYMHDPRHCCCTSHTDKTAAYPAFWRYSQNHKIGDNHTPPLPNHPPENHPPYPSPSPLNPPCPPASLFCSGPSLWFTVPPPLEIFSF